MSFYTRAKLAINSIHNGITSKYYAHISNFSAGKNLTTFRSCFSQIVASKAKLSFFPKRFHNVEKTPKESDEMVFSNSSKWFLASSILICLYYWNLETVPFTKRTRFVLYPSKWERELGKILAKRLVQEPLEVLPETHPNSIRGNSILVEIIKGLAFAMEKEKDSDGLQSTTKHLKDLNWEILVVDKTPLLLCALPEGKIVIHTKLFQWLKTDGEIATFIAIQVATVIARHTAEVWSVQFWSTPVSLMSLLPYVVFTYIVPTPDVSNRIWQFLKKINSDKEQYVAEADAIGMILIAWAGYNPRLAPVTLMRYGHRFRNKTSVFPSAERRAKLVVRSELLEKAIAIYGQRKRIVSSQDEVVIEPNSSTLVEV